MSQLPKNLLVYFDHGKDPAANLRRESELFELVDRGEHPETLRFWVNSECLIRGRKTARYGWYDEKAAARLGVPVFERTSGGGVVYQDEGNLNWSFFNRTGGAFISPTMAFEGASLYIVRALNALGIEAKFSPPNRIDVSGCKVSGMAARSTRRTMLVHGTLLVDSDLNRLNLLCIPPKGSPPASNLRQWARDVDMEEVVRAVVVALEGSGFQVAMV